MGPWEWHGGWGKHKVQQQDGYCDLKILSCSVEGNPHRAGKAGGGVGMLGHHLEKQGCAVLLMKCLPDLP